MQWKIVCKNQWKTDEISALKIDRKEMGKIWNKTVRWCIGYDFSLFNSPLIVDIDVWFRPLCKSCFYFYARLRNIIHVHYSTSWKYCIFLSLFCSFWFTFSFYSIARHYITLSALQCALFVFVTLTDCIANGNVGGKQLHPIFMQCKNTSHPHSMRINVNTWPDIHRSSALTLIPKTQKTNNMKHERSSKFVAEKKTHTHKQYRI